MTEAHKHEQRPFDPADYPALREFFPAYLHQDFGEEYGSAAEAVKGFLMDATGDEILQVKEEWKMLRAALRDRSFEMMQRAFDQLGSCWQPENEAELQELDKLLSHAET
jgi:contact-dependent growth inhibition (CDI) system CdiI-like immunity protein